MFKKSCLKFHVLKVMFKISLWDTIPTRTKMSICINTMIHAIVFTSLLLLKIASFLFITNTIHHYQSLVVFIGLTLLYGIGHTVVYHQSSVMYGLFRTIMLVLYSGFHFIATSLACGSNGNNSRCRLVRFQVDCVLTVILFTVMQL